jgi:peptide deformylase
MLFKKKDRMTRDEGIADISGVQEKYGLRIATIIDDNAWVKAKAREIDLDKELHLARDLDGIMRHMRDLHKFVGVSSNNIYWNLTQTPIRQILIPTTERKYISVINPEILRLEGQENKYVEACGSVPNKVYIVRRKPYVLISGYTLVEERIEFGSERIPCSMPRGKRANDERYCSLRIEDPPQLAVEYLQLEYGSKYFYAGEDPIYSSYSNPEWVIQHEMDHLDGITIKDKGTSLV